MESHIDNSSILDHVFTSMHQAIIVIDKHSKVLVMNRSAKKILNVKDHRLGKDTEQFISSGELILLLNNNENVIKRKITINGLQCTVTITLLHQGTRLIEIDTNHNNLQKDYVQPLFEKMDKVVEFSTDGIFVVSKEGKALFVNSAYENITGFKREQLVGKHMSELMSTGYLDQSVSLLVLNKKKRISILQKIGQQKDVIVTGNPVFDQTGDIQMVVSSVRDITQLNQLTEELKKAKSFSEINHNRYSFSYGYDEKVLFQSYKMKKVIDKIKQVAAFPTSILLLGPSGSGKEVITNLIHQHSDRIDKPFIKINCGAIPEMLLESELFGYVKGAFTGAHQEGKIGLLELADKGTVLLDEIGELPLLLQVKLLRVLQERKIQRLGDNKERELDIRIVSATNQSLKNLVAQGKFREDLYYRLQVIEITIPPLSERPEDTEILLEHFFSYYSQLYNIEKVLSVETKKLLKSYHWPGNVRELKNLVESMIVSVPSQIIKPTDLPQHFISQSYKDSSLKHRIEQFEKTIILDAIQKNSSIRNAAKSLGVHHSTLVKKMKKWENGI
ncbi:PAS domain S-box protein [bacterium LRH843]|nr:PAS domain S-box protein [bacterium LRH843]